MYVIPNRRMKSDIVGLPLLWETPLRTGNLRDPNGPQVTFASESFIDELANAAGKDPLQFRLDLLSKPRQPMTPPPGQKPGFNADDGFRAERMSAVLKMAGEMSGWGKRTLAKGTALGIACHYSHRGYFAEVAEVSVTAEKAVKVHKVWVAADVGSQIINPSGAENQVQGAVIDGLAELMAQEITIENGRVAQSNFHDYPMLKLAEMPKVETVIVPTYDFWCGVGEPTICVVAPAVLNAIQAATGKPVRSLPLKNVKLV